MQVTILPQNRLRFHTRKHFDILSVDSNIISVQRGRWHKHAQELDEARSKAIEIYPSTIISPYSIMPRRLWDLKSNRVVDIRNGVWNTRPACLKASPNLYSCLLVGTDSVSLTFVVFPSMGRPTNSLNSVQSSQHPNNTPGALHDPLFPCIFTKSLGYLKRKSVQYQSY